EQWLHTVTTILPKECAEQILRSGEHFERCPMYHVDVLLALADICDALQRAAWKSGWSPEASVEKMARFLGAILHPDGQIPLFGDSTLDLTPSPREVFARLKLDFPNLQPAGAQSGMVGDYWVYREGGKFLIFDTGPVGPDHLPAHAHADLLTLEASWDGERLFVDTGVYDYEDSPERAYCRSTAAHNTLEIDGQNQCDVWSRFRMGRRGWPGVLQYDSVGPFHYAWCTHNAYRHVGCPEVRRLVLCIENGPWLVADWVVVRGETQSASRLHIPGEWKLCNVSESSITLESPPSRLVIEPGSASGHTGRQGVANYFPEFASKKPVHVLALEAKGANVLVWQIRSEDAAPAGCMVGHEMASFTFRGHECIVFLKARS
ncbi:heparinase II/III domain-containing protein, partial [Thermogutta sp.]|uniref:heparinase II/III domain-containing protein n=1 Tax=Thermogutta sp. TaxID=1962930 RepID=UPI003C7AE79E